MSKVRPDKNIIRLRADPSPISRKDARRLMRQEGLTEEEILKIFRHGAAIDACPGIYENVEALTEIYGQFVDELLKKGRPNRTSEVDKVVMAHYLKHYAEAETSLIDFLYEKLTPDDMAYATKQVLRLVANGSIFNSMCRKNPLERRRLAESGKLSARSRNKAADARREGLQQFFDVARRRLSPSASPAAIVTEMLKDPQLRRSPPATRNTLISDVTRLLKNGNEGDR